SCVYHLLDLDHLNKHSCVYHLLDLDHLNKHSCVYHLLDLTFRNARYDFNNHLSHLHLYLLNQYRGDDHL
ncbi:MAG: hypothetical protein ABSB29_03990, partial [Nitrososphaerales archaeon]